MRLSCKFIVQFIVPLWGGENFSVSLVCQRGTLIWLSTAADYHLFSYNRSSFHYVTYYLVDTVWHYACHNVLPQSVRAEKIKVPKIVLCLKRENIAGELFVPHHGYNIFMLFNLKNHSYVNIAGKDAEKCCLWTWVPNKYHQLQFVNKQQGKQLKKERLCVQNTRH